MSSRVARPLTWLASALGPAAEFVYLPGGFRRHIPDKRNELAERALEDGHEALFFIDADTIFEMEDAQKLLGTFHDRDAEIVTGLTPGRRPPFLPNAVRYDGPVSDDPIRPRDIPNVGQYEVEVGTDKLNPMEMDNWPTLWRADMAGCAFMVIDVEVFQEMDPPWFAANQEHGSALREDSNFTLRATRFEGFDLLVDTRVRLEHLTPEHGITFEYAASFLDHRFANASEEASSEEAPAEPVP